MTTLTQSRGFFGAIGAMIDADHARISQAARRLRLYRETVRSLSALSDRELADIGVFRGNIHEIARGAARNV